MDTTSEVTLRIEGAVAIITLNHPDQRNALDEGMVAALVSAFDDAEADPTIRSAVVTGAGTSFCSGAVLETLIRSADGGFDDVKAVYEGFLRVRRSPLPTIAAVNGPAVGAGLNLALACDVRLAATSSRFESRFPALRLHPGGGHTWMLERAVGRQTATMMALFGEVLDAETACDAGLVVSVHEDAALVAAAVDLGSRLAEIDPEFVRRLTSTLRRAEETPGHDLVLALETEQQQWSTTQPAFVEHTRALQQRITSRRSPS